MATQLADRSPQATATRTEQRQRDSEHRESGDEILREVRQANREFRDFLGSSSAKGLKRRSR
ncbi:MAG: hypothetical protein QOE82_2018 [Thermoanaerobaculia bacterium]|jgi:hypothetical protein|nr:hypothetical protein [Thermoanaerobaculia bacterium]